jgi:signal transduction histidine kinase
MADLVAVLSRLTAGDHDARAVLHRGPAEARALAASVNALADESDRLREAERDAAALQECAVQIGRSIREHLQPAGSVAEAVALLGAALDVDEVYVRTLDGGHLSGVQSRWTRPGSGAPDAQWQSSADPDALRELYAAGDVLHLPDLTRGPIAPALVELVRHTGATAALAVPIGAGERASGMLTLLVRSGPRTWTAAEVSLTRSVATDLGRAVLLGGLFAESEHLVAELQDLDRMKSQFLSTVSHELRTPLTSIAGYVEMVRDGDAGPLPEAAGAMLEVVQRNIRRLNVLIEDLLTLSRIETGAFRVSRSEVCVDDVVADVLRSARPAAEAAGIWLDAAPGPAGLVVEGDAEQLVRMLGQLVSNGVKFSAPGSTVVLTTALDGGRVELVVTDRGIGVPAEELPRLFQRFYRASNAREREVQGLGLGLVIARSVAEHHGGELLLESALGSGTTARVRLPLRQDAAAAAPPTASAGDGPGARAR